VVPPGEVTGAPSATEGGALPPLKRIRKKLRQSVQGLSQVQKIGVGAFRSLGNSVGRVVGQIVTLSDQISGVGDAFRSLGRAAAQILQNVRAISACTELPLSQNVRLPQSHNPCGACTTQCAVVNSMYAGSLASAWRHCQCP